jgi:hypothetical protein
MDLSSGVSDLLPPSPSVVSPIHRPFAIQPLNTNLNTGNAIAGEHPHPHPHPSATPVPPLCGEIHAHPDVALMGPEIRPLNFMSFVAVAGGGRGRGCGCSGEGGCGVGGKT